MTSQETRPRSRWRRLAGVAGALLISGVSIIAAARYEREPPPADKPAPGMTVDKDSVTLESGAPQWKILHLGAATPAIQHWTDPLPARIEIDEAKLSRVGTPLAGRVTRVFVERGQSVAAGAPLFTVSSPNIAELRAEKEKAEVDLKVTKASLDRVKAVVAAHAAAEKDELTAEQEFHQAEVAYQLALAKMRTLDVTTATGNEITVSAPRAGTILEKNVAAAQRVSPDSADALVVVADLSTVWVVADLFEADALSIGAGAAARVSSPSLPDVAALDGTVDLVSAVVDPAKHTIPIRVRLANPGKALRPHVYAQVRFQTGQAATGAEVQASAVMTDGTQSYVYVQEMNGHFVKRVVVAGPIRDGRVLVLQGLTPGEIVVEQGGVLLDNQIDLST
jgi:cobalt-zinc-cadmium efflux system membrane fusion protein